MKNVCFFFYSDKYYNLNSISCYRIEASLALAYRTLQREENQLCGIWYRIGVFTDEVVWPPRYQPHRFCQHCRPALLFQYCSNHTFLIMTLVMHERGLIAHLIGLKGSFNGNQETPHQ